MTAPADIHLRLEVAVLVERQLTGLPNRIGQCLEIVAAGSGWTGLQREPDNLPAARGGEPLGVQNAKVVAVRLRVNGQRTQHRGRLRVDVGQGGDGGSATRGPRATSCRAHDAGSYPAGPAGANIGRKSPVSCRGTRRSEGRAHYSRARA